MKKVILLASLALIGVACSKSDDNNTENAPAEGSNGGSGNNTEQPIQPPVPVEEPAVYPKEKRGNDLNYSLISYELEGKKVKKMVLEHYTNGRRDESNIATTTVTYTDKKYPTKVEKKWSEGSPILPQSAEYTYNDKNQVTQLKSVANGVTTNYTFEYNPQGKLSKVTTAVVGGQESTETFTYPDDKTVVKKISSDANTTFTYTVEGGNVTKEVYERKNEAGHVQFSQVSTYEYEPNIKNPKASYEYSLVTLDFTNNYAPTTGNSKNVLKKSVSQYTDNGNAFTPDETTYTYQVNEQGYPIKVTQRGDGYIEESTFTY